MNNKNVVSRNINTLQVTPFMHVYDVQAAVDFFTSILDFDLHFSQPGFASVGNGPACLRIPQDAIAPKYADGRYGCDFDVLDVDSLYGESLRIDCIRCRRACSMDQSISFTTCANSWLLRRTVAPSCLLKE